MTLSKTKRINWFWPALVLVLVLLSIISLSFFALNNQNPNNSIEAFFSDPAHQSDVGIEGFPVYAQNYANSCGPTTIAMLYSWLVEPITEVEITERLGRVPAKKGMLPGEFAKALNLVLKDGGFEVQNLAHVSEYDFLNTVYEQLKAGMPVPIYFSTENAWDKPNFDTHYSVITGYDSDNQRFFIANAYGFSQEMSALELLSAINYSNYEHPPLEFKLGRLFGLIKPDNLYLVVQR
jgi:hypothetical protein